MVIVRLDTRNKRQIYIQLCGVRGGAVVEALRYKPEGHGIDSQ
jgi:hypothetical protein